MQSQSVRVIEGGGKGFRRVDVTNGVIGEISTLKNVGVRIEELLNFSQSELLADNVAIAFSIAGLIDKNGAITLSPNIPILTGIPLKELVARTYAKKIYVGNDMETAAKGMITIFPEFADCCLVITWSSGIGIRFVWKGDVVSNSEASHICQDHSNGAQLCGCGLRGCADALIGGTGISRRLLSELPMRGVTIPTYQNPCAALDAAYLAGEKWAADMYQYIAVEMGKFLATLVSVIQIPAIIWKGSFAQKALRLPGVENAIREQMRNHLANPDWALKQNLAFRFVPIPPNAIEDSEAFLGAASLALGL